MTCVGREHHVAQRLLLDVAQPVLRVYVMVAGIDAAVVLDRNALAAELAVDAGLCRHPHVLHDQRLAEADQHLAVVAGEPLVPHLGKEIAVLVGIDGPRRHHRVRVVGFRLRRADDRQPRGVPRLRRGRLEALDLDNRDELQVGRAQLAAQEAIDVERPRRVVAIDARQRVERHAEPLEHLRRGIHGVERRRAALGDAVLVVDLLRAVDGEPHEEAVLLQEPRPVLVEQRAVGLQVVLDPLSGFRVFPLQRDDLSKELEAEQRRLAALPREDQFIGGHACDVVSDEALQDLVVHVPAARAARQRLLAQVEAVRAVEIAGRAGRLGHHVESPRGTIAEPLRRVVLVDLDVLVERRNTHG